jgi:nucleoside-diphosphate-sugar epimerase
MGFHPATKLMAEQILSYYADPLEILCLRLFAPYGPGQVDRMIPRLIESVRTNQPITLSRGGEPRLNPIYIADLLEVFAQAVSGAGRSVVNVAGPTAVSVREIAEIAGRALGRDPLFVDRDQGDGGDLLADTTLMHRSFDLERMVEPEDGIRRVVVEAPVLA